MGVTQQRCRRAQSHGISPADNVVKECGEEAGIPAEIARTAT